MQKTTASRAVDVDMEEQKDVESDISEKHDPDESLRELVFGLNQNIVPKANRLDLSQESEDESEQVPLPAQK